MDGNKRLSETALSDYIKMNRKTEKKGKGGPRKGKSLKPTKRADNGPRKANAGAKPKATEPTPQKKLEIKNCHVDLSNKEIYDLFAKFGTLTKCKLLTDDIGRSKGVAIVEFENAEHAKKAIEEYHDKEIKGSKLEVKVAVRKPKVDTDRNKKITKEKSRPQTAQRGARRRNDSVDSYDDYRPRGRGNGRNRSNDDSDRRNSRRNDRNDRDDRNDRNRDNRRGGRGGRNERDRKNSNENKRRPWSRY